MLWAQIEGQAPAQEETIHLSPQFMKELEYAFSFSPIADPLKQKDTLSIEQLHEWVGKPDDWADETLHKSSSRFDSTYFALKMYEKEFMKLMPDTAPKIIIPGLSGKELVKSFGPQRKPLVTFDANALAKYIRPSQIRKRKMRNIADKARRDMDLLFPIVDIPIYGKSEEAKIRASHGVNDSIK